jgi:flavin reductase (DIM6/NTAB) family NADH-FMN oxidoreductase RutF
MSEPAPAAFRPPPPPGAVDAEAFKGIFRGHPAGVAVVTYRTVSGPAGFTATSVISVSADPPVLAFSVAGGTSPYTQLRTVSRVVVNLLAEDQADLALRFASGEDRFAGCDWTELMTGEPVLGGTASWLSGRVTHRVAAGASLLAVVDIQQAARSTPARPLVYADRTFRTLGEPTR